jgi:hypothetical protein
MKNLERIFVALLGLSAWGMSYLGLPVPSGLEALRLASAAAMAGGYSVGRDFMALVPPSWCRMAIIVFSMLVCSLSGIAYLVAIEKMSPGVSMAFVLAICIILIFFPIAFIIGSAVASENEGKQGN